jgi:putrescine transport system substrate-binding protein
MKPATRRISGWAIGAAMVAATALLAGSGLADDPTLNVYNWNDYIGPDVVADFTKATGVKVNYDLYDANETLEAKLAAGHSGYDLVVPTLIPFLARGVQSGLYAEIDHTKIKNWDNLDPVVLAAMAKYDPGNRHAVPWIVGTVGLGVNVDKVKEKLPDAPLDSLDLILKPENAAKLQSCGVTMLDSPSDVIPVVLHYLGRDPESEKPEDLEAATDVLLKIRPYIRKFDSSGYINDLANGDACLSLGYSTDVVIAGVRAKEAKNGVTVRFELPREGALEYIDSMAIPADAPHPELALRWIDFNLEPKIMAATANAVNARTGDKAALPFIRTELTSDPDIYPTPETEKKLFSGPLTSRNYDRLRSRAWTKIKSGS